MICDQCQEDKPCKDYYQSTVCYKCTFKNKTVSKTELKQIKRCKMCNNEIPKENLIYWKACYCCDECAKQGKDQYNKNYWIHKCHAPNVNRGFQYGKSKQV